jgi:hypothetical protein
LSRAASPAAHAVIVSTFADFEPGERATNGQPDDERAHAPGEAVNAHGLPRWNQQARVWSSAPPSGAIIVATHTNLAIGEKATDHGAQ